jgi:hypothetical protein
MRNKTKKHFLKKKKIWNTLPWSEAESALSFYQSCVFKATKTKDNFHRKKLNCSLTRDIRLDLFLIRKHSERKRPTLIFKKTLFQKNSSFESFFFEFLKFRNLSSSQRFKLGTILSENSFFAKGFIQQKFFSSSLDCSLFQDIEFVFQKSFLKNKRLSEKSFSEKEKFFSFILKKFFEIFPTRRSFQAFQFYWILLLSMEERFQYLFEPESEDLVEPNLRLIKSQVLQTKSFEQRRSGLQPLQFLKYFFETGYPLFFPRETPSLNKESFQPVLENQPVLEKIGFFSTKRNETSKSFHSTDCKKHPFVIGSFQSRICVPSKKKKEWFQNSSFLFQNIIFNLSKDLTLYGLKRIRAFLFENEKQKRFFFHPFFFFGLDFDIKKWENSKQLQANTFSREENSPLFHEKKSQSSCFLLFGSEQDFLLFHWNKKRLVKALKFLRDWIESSFLNIGYHSIYLSDLKKGIQFQNHFILLKKRIQRIQAKPPYGKIFASFQNQTLEIFPAKSYQKRFLEDMKSILLVCRGKSSKFLILSLNSLISVWSHSIFCPGNKSLIRKIFREMDSIVLFHLFRWAQRTHPNWSKKKIVERYFPREKIWSYDKIKRSQNWVFCDPFTSLNIKEPSLFLHKLSWLRRKNLNTQLSSEILFSGIFHQKKICKKVS